MRGYCPHTYPHKAIGQNVSIPKLYINTTRTDCLLLVSTYKEEEISTGHQRLTLQNPKGKYLNESSLQQPHNKCSLPTFICEPLTLLRIRFRKDNKLHLNLDFLRPPIENVPCTAVYWFMFFFFFASLFVYFESLLSWTFDGRASSEHFYYHQWRI